MAGLSPGSLNSKSILLPTKHMYMYAGGKDGATEGFERGADPHLDWLGPRATRDRI